MTRRQVYQRGEEQNKKMGFWGMIKSVTPSPSGSKNLSLIQQEVDAFEELSRQLFLETVKLQATKEVRQISCIPVGILIVTSIRGLLITLTEFFYAISSSKSSNVIMLMLAQIMGMYFVSSMLLMRMSMSLEYRTIVIEALGKLQFNFYHRWFDVIFLVSALSSILYLA